MSEANNAFETAPYRPVALAEPDVEVREGTDGSLYLKSPDPLRAYHRQVGIPLREWASKTPDRTWLAERVADGEWRKLTYARGRELCDRISQALLDRGLGPDRPLMILSENSIHFGVLAMAAMQVGIPVAPISPAYSLVSKDFSKLKPIYELLGPGVIYVEDGRRFEAALRAIDDDRFELVATRDPIDGMATTSFDDLADTTPGPDVEAAFADVAPEDTAKYLFTSGSTGMPKAVINTHRMLCANQQMCLQIFPFLTDIPPVIVDWLPWNHTAGGNIMFNLVLFNGGSFYIDAGRPVPGLFEITLRNLRDISPTIYFNVPNGFAALLPHLEADADFRDHFFKDLVFSWYAAAALSQDLWDRFERVAFQAIGQRVVIVSGFGTTESAPSLTFSYWPGSSVGNVGLPQPGAEVKLTPVGDKLEIRARGDSISPGYYKDPQRTADSRDEEGFYCFGDAMKFADPFRPELGLLFDGRLSENFKLSSGTWVNVGPLRTDIIDAAAPAIQDLVVCGHDADFVAILAWPSLAGCQSISGLEGETDLSRLITDQKVRDHVAERIAEFNKTAGGSSRRIRRILLMEEPPQIDGNEITDKGYINQRATRERRGDLVAELLRPAPSARVIVAA